MSKRRMLSCLLSLFLLASCDGCSDDGGGNRSDGGPGHDPDAAPPSAADGGPGGAPSDQDGSAGDHDGGGGGQDGAVDPRPQGDFVVGTVRIEVEAQSGRVLPVQLWYPAVESARAEAAAGRPTQEFEPEGDKRDQLATLVSEAPEGCTRKTMNAADAPEVFARAEPYPLLVFSHCMDCIRFSAFTIAEHLAGRGFVVAAPDHVDGTLYENNGTLTSEFLTVRAADVRSVLDVLLDADASVVPSALRGQLDAQRIGMFGHSYGSVTTGLVLQTDARVRAGVMMAAPPESPLLAGVTLKELQVPGLFFEATEDGSITALGNLYIESNFRDYPAPAWLVKVTDAGHWSFSDIAGIGGTFKAGCGMGVRATGLPFSYLDIDVARGIAKNYIAAFFAKELLGDAQAGTYLTVGTPQGVVSITHHD